MSDEAPSPRDEAMSLLGTRTCIKCKRVIAEEFVDVSDPATAHKHFEWARYCDDCTPEIVFLGPMLRWEKAE